MADSVRPRSGGCGLAALLLCLIPLAGFASEPEGDARLTWAWLDPGDHPATSDGSARLLSVVIDPLLPLGDSAIVVDVPAALAVEALGQPDGGPAPPFTVEPGPIGARTLRLELRDWPARLPRTFLFAIDEPDPQEAGAILEIAVQGVGPDGRPRRAATGITVGRPGAPSRIRGGAVEYRAATGGGS